MSAIVTSRLRRMPPWDDRERASLVALLQEPTAGSVMAGVPQRSSQPSSRRIGHGAVVVKVPVILPPSA